MKVLVVFIFLFFTCLSFSNGCRRNSDCGWFRYCDGGTFWRDGKCVNLIPEGSQCLRGDPKSCQSKRCICDYCANSDGKHTIQYRRCATNDNCKSGLCHMFGGGTSWGCRGYCYNKAPDGAKCSRASFYTGDFCQSGQCTCGICGRKVNNGQSCSTNDNCHSGLCMGGPKNNADCTGTCVSKQPDGGDCPFGDEQCLSGRCHCDKCGQLNNGNKCSKNSHCKTGWCDGRASFGGALVCFGICKSKGNDGESCNDEKFCASGQCTCGVCGRKLKSGKRCSTRDNCESGDCRGWITVGCGGKCA